VHEGKFSTYYVVTRLQRFVLKDIAPTQNIFINFLRALKLAKVLCTSCTISMRIEAGRAANACTDRAIRAATKSIHGEGQKDIEFLNGTRLSIF